MNIVIITLDKCPNYDAGAVRTHIMSKICVEQGHDVTVISMGPYNKKIIKLVDSVKYISFRNKRNSFLYKVYSYALFWYKVKKYLNHNNCDVLIHTQIDFLTLRVIKKYTKLKDIYEIYDSVEWFSSTQFKFGSLSYTYLLNDYLNSKYLNEKYKVISISSYLCQNFKNRNIPTLLMPVVLNVSDIPYVKNNKNNKIKIIYAGSPGKKDYLDTVIKSINLLNDDEKELIDFKVIGCTKDYFIKKTLLNNVEISDSITFMGRLSRDQVIEEYKNADFSILIRSETSRYAKAGFPTKLVESLATATPIICNYTSDIDKYVLNYVNGIISNGEDEYSCLNALKQVIKLDKNTIKLMQANARNTAEKYFEYKTYSKKLIEFIES